MKASSYKLLRKLHSQVFVSSSQPSDEEPAKEDVREENLGGRNFRWHEGGQLLFSWNRKSASSLNPLEPKKSRIFSQMKRFDKNETMSKFIKKCCLG